MPPAPKLDDRQTLILNAAAQLLAAQMVYNAWRGSGGLYVLEADVVACVGTAALLYSKVDETT